MKLKNFPDLFYLKFQVRYFKTIYFFKKVSSTIRVASVFTLEYLSSVKSFFSHLNRLNKTVFLSFFVVLMIGSGVMIGKTYSQSFPQTNTDTTSTALSSTSAIPPGAVEAEMTQFFTAMNQVIQGTPDSTGNYSGGVIQMMSNVDAYIYINNPISFGKYANYYAQTHGIIPNTYAADATTGSGYNTLAPIIPLWDLTRNIAYLIIAVMIVVIGFIIIFGGKYGQTEVSIVNSIPKIIMALILITFSYPIAGFAIDISNLGTNMIVNLLGPQFVNQNVFYPGQYPVSCNIPITLSTSDPSIKDAQFNGSNTFVSQCGFAAKGAAAGFGGDFNVFRLMAPMLLYNNWSSTSKGYGSVTNLIQTPTNIGILDFFLQDFKLGVQGFTDITLSFILSVLFLYWAIKIFILILTSFIRIVTATLMGPFVLISYPLNGAGAFWNYAKSLLAPALVFPAVFAMLFIAAIFAFGTDCITNASGQPNSTSTPCVSNLSDSDFGPWYIATNNNITNFNSGPLLFVDTVNPAFIWNIVAIGIIVAIPGIGKQIDEALKNEVSRHLEEQGRQAGQNALKYLSKVPFVGGLLGNII